MDSVRRQPGSVILHEFRQAMQHARAAGQGAPRFRPAARTFAAAETNRLTAGWLTSDASINALLQSALPLLRMRSRSWARNTGPGRRFLSLVRNGMVGPFGFTVQMRCGDWVQQQGRWVWKLDKLANDAIEAAWKEWCLVGNCEVTGKLSFADVCKLQSEILARDGEHLARRVRGADNKWGYALQLLATDRLDVARNETPYAGNEVRMGVERDEKGRPVAYHILRFNPGDARGTRDAERIPAREVLHDFVPVDAEQARGVPWAHAVLLGSHMLAAFSESAVYAARVGASHMGFFLQGTGPDLGPVKTEDFGAKPAEAAVGEDKLITDLEPGALELLPKGIVDFKAFDSRYPSEAFGPFVKAHKHDVAAGLDVAHHNLSGDMEGVNYSGARIAELGERDNWRGLTHRFIGTSVRTVFLDWLEMSLLKGAITVPGGGRLPVTKLEKFAAGLTVRGRGWEWVDPKNEALANQIAVKEHFKTRTQVVAASGGNYEDNVLEIAEEQTIRETNGVELESTAPAPAAGGAASEEGDSSDNAAGAGAGNKEPKK